MLNVIFHLVNCTILIYILNKLNNPKDKNFHTIVSNLVKINEGHVKMLNRGLKELSKALELNSISYTSNENKLEDELDKFREDIIEMLDKRS